MTRNLIPKMIKGGRIFRHTMTKSRFKRMPTVPSFTIQQVSSPALGWVFPNLLLDETQDSMQDKKRTLYNLIVKVLRINSMLHYFQGYHDIAQVFLLVLGEQAAFEAVSRVSLLRIRDYMLSSLGPSTRHLQLIPAILYCTDPVLARHLSQTPPYFALSSVLTLYAHEIQRYADIARLYDFILAHEPVMTVYLFVALIVYRRTELLEIEDQDMLLFVLSKLPQTLDLQALVEKSLDIFKAHPPESLPGYAWHNISSYSVLKTSRRNLQKQTLGQGRALFKLQSRQLAREELAAKVLKQVGKNRRSIISIGATVLVGFLSFYLRKSGNDKVLWTTFWHVAQLWRG